MPRINWPGWGAGLALVAFVHQAVIVRLVSDEWSRADFDYCYLIPFVMAYLVWERRGELAAIPSRASWAGLWAFGASVFFLLLGELGGEFLSLYISLWFAILGVCWTLLGWRKLKVILFPLALLLMAFPPPNYLYGRLTLGMQLLSTRIGVEFLHLLGLPAFREGNVIDMGFTQLEVVAACSGLRFLIPLAIVGMLLTYYFRETWWKRTLLMLFTLPLAIVMNGLRIGVSGVLARSYGPGILEGAAHDTMGWVMFLVSAVILLGCMKLMTARGKPMLVVFAPVSGSPAIARVSLMPLLAGLALLAATNGYLQYRAMTPDVLPTARPLSAFPVRLGEWEGVRVPMERKFIDELDFTDYVQVDFRNGGQRAVDFYVAWYDRQSKGESIHSPETCLRGGGWRFERDGAVEVAVPDYKTVRVNRTMLEQNGRRMLSYFWFPARGRYLTNGVELKLYTMWDSLTLRRTDGALVRLITPLYPGEGEADAERRLVDFLAVALPPLERMLPGRDPVPEAMNRQAP
ncbi:exosortase D, VPLPA-CTERM-specific [Desulfomicrobium norvegicum]|uniref:Exosortase D, VPLPA-CTERM-specific n=1 Tax=Desulfomicrobium norvegicum (strain DSM 1741 / NCIMB 8310) TaxID=52561 RepID=A0A8G2C677_DESNO|nr:VPLPA-CTERM-specific exosortase XrtD [Desulfomicrobium norvegicum]SFM21722.1 exosortase D, VPLPA-CTERM-specific [Desulfomicrobium norvegicum]